VFGSNAGGELYVFNTKEQKPWRVYIVDDISMTQEDVQECAPDFMTFVQAFGRSRGLEEEPWNEQTPHE
jgi:hypothetical protein